MKFLTSLMGMLDGKKTKWGGLIFAAVHLLNLFFPDFMDGVPIAEIDKILGGIIVYAARDAMKKLEP